MVKSKFKLRIVYHVQLSCSECTSKAHSASLRVVALSLPVYVAKLSLKSREDPEAAANSLAGEFVFQPAPVVDRFQTAHHLEFDFGVALFVACFAIFDSLARLFGLELCRPPACWSNPRNLSPRRPG